MNLSVYILVHKLYLYFVHIINEIIFLLSLWVMWILILLENMCFWKTTERKSAFTKYNFI